MSIIKSFSPCPNDKGSSPLEIPEHQTNRSAYKQYVVKQDEEQNIDLKNFDAEKESQKLDSMDQSGQLKFLVNLVFSQRKTLSRLEKNQNLIIDGLINTKVYSMMHKKHNQLMIGYSADFVSRRKRHEQAGWIYLGSRPGSQQKDEKVLKNVIKQFGIEPVPASKEIFIITNELIELLVAFDWVGISENKSKILTRNPQLTLGISENL